MLIILDNAESILDPQGTNAREIYTVMEELSRFNNICICITSRISTTPPGCKRLDVPTLSMDAGCDTFYRIYDGDADRSDVVNRMLEQLDCHPLSIMLLATVAHQNKWDMSRLTREWEKRRTGMLQTHHSESLATTIELSLASPLFQELGPDARALLGIVAFFPQGVDENNLEWLFPTISNRTGIFDRFCILSLAHRSNGFITMLAPLRDYLSPHNPKTSPLLLATKTQYFTRMSVTDGQFDAAEGAASRAIDLLPETGEQFQVCRSHRTLGNIYESKGDTKKAIYHFEVALGIASPFNWHSLLFCLHYDLAWLFYRGGRFDDAQTHIERAKSRTASNAYRLGGAVELQARVWYDQHRLEEAKSEALHAVDVYEKLGAEKDVERCGQLLRDIGKKLSAPIAFDCELLKVFLLACIDSSL